MKYWVMRFVFGDETTEHRHVTKESAERDACLHIIEKSFSALDADEEDDDLKDEIVKFFTLIDLGGYAQAITHYQKLVEEQDWDEKVFIEEETLMTEGDVPLLQVAARERANWGGREEDESADEGEGDESAA